MGNVAMQMPQALGGLGCWVAACIPGSAGAHNSLLECFSTEDASQYIMDASVKA